jgi:predicted  nucleic acid-binding Zn-ribbon protein
MRVSDQNNPDVIQFNPSTRGTDRNDDQVDQVGEAMLQLLGRAADAIESTNQQAHDKAQRLAHELRGAQDRIRQLESEIATLQERADHAEQWLHRIHAEIEGQFLNKNTRRAATR